MSQRVVLTGGASQLTGMADFVSQYWKRRATLALPHHIMGLDEQSSNPAFSALVGMALHVARIADDDFGDFNLQFCQDAFWAPWHVAEHPFRRCR